MESYDIPVQQVAEYLLDKLDADAEDCISNLKLQKLVYYSQGFVMALMNKKLFNADIEAWAHGPVVPELYHKYKPNGSCGIPKPANTNYEILNQYQELKDIIDEVYQVYGQFSAWKLRNMTHTETPWINTPQNSIISDKSMLEFFKTQVV